MQRPVLEEPKSGRSAWAAALMTAAVALWQAPSASATTISDPLTLSYCKSNCASGPFGTVAVSSVDANDVTVALTLAPGEVFNIAGGTGAGKPLLFELSGNPTVSVSGLPAGFSLIQMPPPGMIMADGSGSWNYAIVCPSSCGSGTSQWMTNPTSLFFTITSAAGISPMSFVQNGKSLFFATDIGVSTGTPGSYGTYDVAATSASQVPLPAAGFLLLSALGALGLFGRRRFARG